MGITVVNLQMHRGHLCRFSISSICGHGKQELGRTGETMVAVKSLRGQIGFGQYPTVIGEIEIVFDIDDEKPYRGPHLGYHFSLVKGARCEFECLRAACELDNVVMSKVMGGIWGI